LPSGVFAANAAWLSIAAMAHNLLRAAGVLASLPYAKARVATIRRDLIAVAARAQIHPEKPSALTVSTSSWATSLVSGSPARVTTPSLAVTVNAYGAAARNSSGITFPAISSQIPHPSLTG
jgi:hypothetical protein